MPSTIQQTRPEPSKPGAMSDRRRERLRLDISREAARLFWRQGVAATSGDQIAAAVGLSVRTLWRHFRNKESCAEPIVGQGVDGLLAMLRRWPDELSLEDHFAAELGRRSQQSDPRQAADDLLSVQLVGLADREPDIRATWLMANDRVEQQLAGVVAGRLGRPTGDLEVRRHAAAAAAVVRVVHEDLSRRLLAGEFDRVDISRTSRDIARAVRTATGGAIGDPARA